MKAGKLAPLIKEFYPEYYIWNEYDKDNCVAFNKVNEEWGILGNFTPTPVIVDGISFVNNEQLFQLMKFSDRETVQTIYNKRGLPIKMFAKSAEKRGLRRADWGQIVVDCMKFCLQSKYDQSEDFRQILNDSKGRIIVEDQTGRVKSADTWGVVLIGDKYVGSNLMGRLLMELRDDNGKLDYHLPKDIFSFTTHLK